ncbi:MAG TPA: TIGR03118 family protein [Candidatus Sulfotelmatobacter sp.]|nr:TIGR03118 family protein [Candidatus Sulfotelmatobacter sp.]
MLRLRNWKRAAGTAALALAFLLLAASNGLAQHYQRTDLTTDNATVSPTAPNVDPNLVNPWGMSRSSGSPWWISDNGTGLSTLYDSTGVPKSLVVTIPAPDGQPGGTPTGTVFNYTGAFEVGPGQSAFFLFATEDGTISGWNPGANPTAAIIKVNRAGSAIYKGLALATTTGGPRLYASNFQSGKVEVFNGTFQSLTVSGGFNDPNLPANYAPFGIQNVGGNIVVTFAHRKPGSHDEDHGPGLGFVDVFDLSGHLLLRLQHASLNAPWGIALAPGDFGPFSHRLLIGNFGDGLIHAFNAVSGKLEGTLLDSTGAPLTIGGLWALSFGGDNLTSGLATALFFTAGANDEADGIYGMLTPTSTEQRGNSE